MLRSVQSDLVSICAAINMVIQTSGDQGGTTKGAGQLFSSDRTMLAIFQVIRAEHRLEYLRGVLEQYDAGSNDSKEKAKVLPEIMDLQRRVDDFKSIFESNLYH
eukprot:GEZU01000365.1.p2 GENE.GEZU01000365.1~~GEZU01000365.1.p2  ORF type:complete len:104 (+),score=29.12 GEZU01000365.1:325-636(+)